MLSCTMAIAPFWESFLFGFYFLVLSCASLSTFRMSLLQKTLAFYYSVMRIPLKMLEDGQTLLSSILNINACTSDILCFQPGMVHQLRQQCNCENNVYLLIKSGSTNDTVEFENDHV